MPQASQIFAVPRVFSLLFSLRLRCLLCLPAVLAVFLGILSPVQSASLAELAQLAFSRFLVLEFRAPASLSWLVWCFVTAAGCCYCEGCVAWLADFIWLALKSFCGISVPG